MKVFLYVLDTLSDWEIGYVTAELNSRRFLLKGIDCELVKVGSSSNDLGYLRTVAAEYAGQDGYLDLPAVSDRNLVTASGLSPVVHVRALEDPRGRAGGLTAAR